MESPRMSSSPYKPDKPDNSGQCPKLSACWNRTGQDKTLKGCPVCPVSGPEQAMPRELIP